MQESSKDTFVLVSIVALTSFVISGVCEYLYDSIKGKQNQKIKKQVLKNQPPPRSPDKYKSRGTIHNEKAGKWGVFKVVNCGNNTVLQELQLMGMLTTDVERVNNLIVDLEMEKDEMIPNPIIAYKPKMRQDDPFLSPDALVQPMSFVLQTPELRSAQMISFTKKWLRSGPRSHILWNPSNVKAAIVSMGGMVPGVNAAIKQLVYTLEQTYGVKQIIGIKHSFETNKKMTVPLTCNDVKTIHHFGGSFLGVNRSDLSAEEVIDRVVEDGVNQLYIIGGPGTLKLANELHELIKLRKLRIAFCVIPKEITKAIPITEKTLGYQTALEESQKSVREGYTQSHCHDNGVAIVKIAGKDSGLLALEASLVSRNIQACLVPQFPFELYGDNGLLAFIHNKLISRSNCTIVVAEGCNESILDYQPPVVAFDWEGTPIKQDINKIIKSELKRYLYERKVRTAVKTIDSYQIRASPANSKEMSLSCKFASESIHCVMSGYTNFMMGSITNRTVMIPIQEVISGNYSDQLVQYSNHWARLLLMTSQPSFLNQQ